MNDNQPESEGPRFDETQVRYAMQQLQREQNLALGAMAGAVGALAGAAIWAVVTVMTSYQIGWMAVGVGFLVGISVRTAGKGITQVFGLLGALLALLGCGLGNLLAVCAMLAAEHQMEFLEVLSRLTPDLVKEIMIATFSPMDLLFYGFAVYSGYRLSFRRVTEADIEARLTGYTAVS